MSKEEVKKLFQDENFIEELNRVNSMETLQKFLNAKGVKMSMDDMDKAIKKGNNTELSESELSFVSGGSNVLWIKLAYSCFMFSAMD